MRVCIQTRSARRYRRGGIRVVSGINGYGRDKAVRGKSEVWVKLKGIGVWQEFEDNPRICPISPDLPSLQRPAPRLRLYPAGVCARWAAFVAERGAQEALGRIVLDCDSLLHSPSTPAAECRMGGTHATERQDP